MKQRINVAVEIQSRTVTRRTKFIELLREYALENSFVKKSFVSVGKADSTKTFFRFKYVEKDELNQDIKSPGFYWWTANDFKDLDVKVISVTDYTYLLDNIKEPDYVEKPFVLAGRPLIVDKPKDRIIIGCKNFNRNVVRNFFVELLEQGIEQVSFKFQGGSGDRDTLTRSGTEEFLRRIDRGE